MDPPSAEQLVAAAMDGDLELVQQLLRQGVSVRTLYGWRRYTILHIAAAAGQLNVVQHLVEAGADLEAKDRYGSTALHIAAGPSQLHVVAGEGHVGVAAFLMACGLSPNAKDRSGDTPLGRAVTYNNTAMMRLLMWAGADIHVVTSGGSSLLHLASMYCCCQAASLLLASGAAVDGVDSRGCTPLHGVYRHRSCVQMVELLLAAGASVDARDGDGQTPLLAACRRSGHLPIIQALLRHGAQPDARDANGWTALHIATVSANDAVLRYLLAVPELQSVLDAADNKGCTALRAAIDCLDASIEYNSSHALELLLAAGADVHLKYQGMTPLQMAVRGDCLDLVRGVEALLAAGADADALFQAGVATKSGDCLEGVSTLQLAVQTSMLDAVPLLATPTNLRRLLQGPSLTGVQGQVGEQEQQQQQQGGDLLSPTEVVSVIAKGVHQRLIRLGVAVAPDVATGVQWVVGCFPAVMEVLGAAAAGDLLQQVLDGREEYLPEVPALLLQAVHSGWLGAMPWLQHTWQITDQLQQLVIQPLQEQLLLLQLGVRGATGDLTAAAAAAAGQQALQPPAGHGRPTRLRLWAEAEAAADAGDWRLCVQRLQRLTELRHSWATYPLARFAQRHGRGYEGVAGLCKALLASWCELQQQQQPAVKVTPELRDAVVTAVQASQCAAQQGTEPGGGNDGQ